MVIVFDLVDYSILVFEQATSAVWTEPPLVELFAKLGLILIVLWLFVDHLRVTMSELALVAITTLP